MKRTLAPLIVVIVVTGPGISKPARPLYEPPEPPSADLSVVIDNDVIELGFREAKIPFQFDRESQPKMRAIRLFVSEDRGKTWKLTDERKANDATFAFRTTRDGLFWFAVQTVQHDGIENPSTFKDLSPALKVYVNQERRTLLRQAGPPVQSQVSK